MADDLHRAPPPELRLSVIVPTRNRAARLRKALGSLVAQDIPSGQWEIVVVDNGSTDETREVVAEFGPRGPVRYAYEPIRGSGKARNRGIAEARGQLLAFTDDDVHVHPDWASRIVARFAEDPAIAAVFGYTYADAEVPDMFSLRTRGHTLVIEGKEQVWQSSATNNMAVRRGVLNRVGAFDPLLGRGAKYHSGEDGEFQYRFLKAGYKALYDPEIQVKHEPDVAARSVEREILEADAGAAAWYGKHAARGDLYTVRMFAVHVGRNVLGLRSLAAAIRRRDGAELRLRARRLAVLVRAFVLRGIEELSAGGQRRA